MDRLSAKPEAERGAKLRKLEAASGQAAALVSRAEVHEVTAMINLIIARRDAERAGRQRAWCITVMETAVNSSGGGNPPQTLIDHIASSPRHRADRGMEVKPPATLQTMASIDGWSCIALAAWQQGLRDRETVPGPDA